MGFLVPAGGLKNSAQRSATVGTVLRDSGKAGGRIKALQLVVLCLAFMMLWVSPKASFAAGADVIKLVYSTDDALCEPLSLLYNELNHNKQASFSYLSSLYWEDVYLPKFLAIGLKPPVLLKDASYPDDGRSQSDKFKAGFYALHRGNPLQMVYLQDLPLAREDGNKTTQLWLIKPGVVVPPHPSPDFEIDVPPGINGKDVQLGVFFSLGKNGATYSQDPILYPVRGSGGHLSYPAIIGPYPVVASGIRESLGDGSAVIQRLFEWHGNIIVTARDFTTTAVVYRFTDTDKITDVCRFVSQGTLDFIAHQHNTAGNPK